MSNEQKLWLLILMLAAMCISGVSCSDSSNETIVDGDSDLSETEEEREAEEDTVDGLFDSAWWQTPDESSILGLLDRSTFFKENAWLIEEMSSWFEENHYSEKAEIPGDASQLGYYPVANGKCFAFVGTYFPRNTLHELLGPDYQKGGQGYFSDFSAMLDKDGTLLSWKSDRIWKPRQAQVVVTNMAVDGADLELDTVAFIPSEDSGMATSVLLQVHTIRNNGEGAISGLQLRLQSYGYGEDAANDSKWLEQVRDDHRLRVRALDVDFSQVEVENEKYPALVSPEMTVEAGEEKQFVIVYEFVKDGEEVGSGYEAVQQVGWKTLLDRTAAWWRKFHQEGLMIHTPDRRVDDLLETNKAVVRSQITEYGGIVPMSHYTNTWIRDSFGPTRFLLKFGYTELAWGLSDYYYKAAALRGGIGNAVEADMDVTGEIPELDWMSEIPFSGRLRGEGPSYLPLMHTWCWRYTGEAKRLQKRWEYLMHTLKGQEVTDKGLMYFSGDETFRPVMAYNMGLDLEYKFEELTYSANSGFLFVRAAEMLGEFGEKVGLQQPEDLAWLAQQAEVVRNSTEQQYWMEATGRYSPFIYMDTMAQEIKPGEDVNTKPLWLNYLGRDDERARENIDSVMDESLRDNGLIQNQFNLDDTLLGVPIGPGLMTGMSIAYFMYNGAELNLDVADKTFDSIGAYAIASGTYSEVMLFALPRQAVSPFYDRVSTSGETWARCRPWEGAISAEAIEHYLIGFEADVPGGWMMLAPRLVHDSNWIEAENLAFGPLRLSMRFEREEDSYSFTITSPTEPDTAGLEQIYLRLHVAKGKEFNVFVDGEKLPQTDLEIISDYDSVAELRLTLAAKQGEQVVTIEPIVQ